MSEYQYYEFLAVDRPLDDRQLAEVRSLSTRARITPTSFVNEYHWGNFRGDPNRMMERFYDAHLYLANWGTQRIMLRLPRGLLDIDIARDYCVGDQVIAWTTNEYLVLDLTSEDEAGDFDPDAVAPMSAIVGVRAELAAGDLRPLYLAWLAGYSAREAGEYAVDHDAEDLEPPVPPGLATLTAAQHALADFLRVDDDLLAIATQTSAPLAETTDVPGELAAWVQDLPVAEKDRLLLRIADDHAAGQAEQQARRAKARALAREKRIDELARDEEAAWSRIDAMIATRKPDQYDAAAALLTDLQALADRDGRRDTFTQRSQALRHTHARKPRLLERLDRAGV
ncbi:hypothetical protein [Rhodococcus koreensis]